MNTIFSGGSSIYPVSGTGTCHNYRERLVNLHSKPKMGDPGEENNLQPGVVTAHALGDKLIHEYTRLLLTLLQHKPGPECSDDIG